MPAPHAAGPSSPCPVCREQTGRLVRTVTSAEAAQHYVLEQVHPERFGALRAHIEALWGGEACDVVACGACGFTFADPFVAGDERFYTLAYERTGYPGWKWEFERTREALEGRPSPGGFTLLELGAGDGAFVRRVAPALTPKANVVCVEYSAYGREQIERYGIPCLAEDVRAWPPERYRGHFDVICLFQVLEHMDALDALFERLGHVARPSADVFVAVPNERRIAFNEANGSLLDLPPNHIGRWTRRSFEVIAQRHGWRLAEHAVEEEGAVQKAKAHLEYVYCRVRQAPGSIGNRVERIRSRRLRRVGQAAGVGLYAARALPGLLTLVTGEGLGSSQWVHLRRGETATGAPGGPASGGARRPG